MTREIPRTQPDVVIAGGGPTGLMLAAELSRAGVSVTVLERRREPSGLSRAPGIYARTIEILHERGLLEHLVEGRPTARAHFALLAGLDLGEIDSRHAVLMVPQAAIERVLAERAAELGVRVLRGHEVNGLREVGDSVEVGVIGPDGARRLSAAYLVGCDGAHSTVRRLLGARFPGTDPTIDVLFADLTGVEAAVLDMPRSPFPLIRTDRGWLVAVEVESGCHRVMVCEFDRTPARSGPPVSFGEFREAVNRIGGFDLDSAVPRWISRFNDTSRQVQNYRHGRVFLAGDAAHVHPPFGGQGLNLGIQDAVNLGWKLAAHIAGWAPTGLLDTYHSERHPVAARVLLNTRAQNLLMRPGAEIDAMRTLVSEFLGTAEINRRMAEEVSAIGIRYDVGGEHPLVGRRLSGLPRIDPGVHAIQAVNGTLLLLRASPELETLATPWSGRVAVVRVECSDLASKGVFALLVRPDGHIVWASTADPSPDLTVALTQWFGRP